MLSIDYRRSRLHVNNQSTRIISTEKVGCTGSPTLYIFPWLYPLIYQMFMQSSLLYRCMPLAYLPFIFPSSMVFIVDQVDQNITGANIFFFFFAFVLCSRHFNNALRGSWFLEEEKNNMFIFTPFRLTHATSESEGCHS